MSRDADAAMDSLPFSVVVWEVVDDKWQNCVVRHFNPAACLLLRPVIPLQVGLSMGELFPNAHEDSAMDVIRANESGEEIDRREGFGEHHVTPGYFRMNTVRIRPSRVRVLFYDISEHEYAKDRLQNELQSQQNLLYFASHDLAEPLRNARMLLDLATHEDCDDDYRAVLLGKAQSALIKGQRLVGGLNEYRKLTNLGTNGPISLGDCLSEAQADIAALVDSGAVIEIEGVLPEVKANRFALVTILRNLLSNAIKYTNNETNAHITIRAERSGINWRVSVSDQGVGFEPEQAESIFQLGTRLYPSDAGWGDGIGLSNCRAAAASQGGTIWAESEGVGKGARFTFTVPAAEDPPR